MASIGKKFGQFKQWTGEKIGSTQKTELSQEFKQLEMETDARIDYTEQLVASLDAYLKSITKLRDIHNIKGKKTPVEALAISMLSYAQRIPSQSQYSKTLLATGDAYDRIVLQQTSLGETLRDSLLTTLQRNLNDIKDYQNSRSKMEKRRLDLDAKLNKMYKSKKENPELEEETRIAQNKYEESLQDISYKMSKLAENELEQQEGVFILLDAQFKYYEECLKLVSKARSQLAEIPRQPHLRNDVRMNMVNPSPPRPLTSDFTGAIPIKSMTQSKSMEALKQERLAVPGQISQTSSVSSNLSSVDKNVLKRVRCTFDFTAEGNNEMSIKKGDIIDVTCYISEGWWEGENIETNEFGMFPSNYAEEIFDAPAQTPPPVRNPSALSSRSPSFSYLAPSNGPQNLSSNNNLSLPGNSSARSSTSSIRSRSVSPVPPSPASRKTVSPRNSSPPAPPSRSRATSVEPLVSRTPSNNEIRQSLVGMSSNPFINNSNTSINNNLNFSLNAKCTECDCVEYVAHAFKKDQCNNCYHKHI